MITSGVRQQSTLPPIARDHPYQPFDLCRWPLLTFLPLVHTEEVSGVAGQRARSSNKRQAAGLFRGRFQEASEAVSELQHLLNDLSFRLKSHARCTQNLLDLTDQAQQCLRIEANVFDHR